jgi:hypothetical protein
MASVHLKNLMVYWMISSKLAGCSRGERKSTTTYCYPVAVATAILPSTDPPTLTIVLPVPLVLLVHFLINISTLHHHSTGINLFLPHPPVIIITYIIPNTIIIIIITTTINPSLLYPLL